MMASRQLGKYEILEEIGRGGFSVVYKARDTTLNRIVALKVLVSHLLSDSAFVKRFRAEFETVSNLHYPSIVSVYEYGEVQGQPYIAMEYIAGKTLAQIIEESDGPLPSDEAYHIVRQVASALTHALRQGVVHRDLKPSNIMVDAEGHVKLTDFGIAKIAGRAFQTTTGRIFGSPEYMSPEQARSEELDHRSDVYSLGVVLYEMLTGKTPFAGDTPVSVMVSHAECEPPPPSQLNPSLPKPVEMVILKALTKSRAERFQSAAEMAHYLARAIEGSPLPIKLPPRLPSAPKPNRSVNRQKLWIGLGGVAALIAVIMLALVLLQPFWGSAPATPTRLVAAQAPTLTNTPLPTLPSPTFTRTPIPPSLTPSNTPTSLPSDTPQPTNSPYPTYTPLPTNTPYPTLPCPSGTVRIGSLCATMTPLPTAPWKAVYSDSFSDDDEGKSEDNWRWYIRDGEFYLDIITEKRSITKYNSKTLCKNCRISVRARFVGENTPSSYGIAFRRTTGFRLTFEIAPDGKYRVRRYDNGDWELIRDWQYRTEIKTGHQVNWLGLECIGDTLYLYINDENIDEITGIDVIEGEVGLFGESGDRVPVTIAFDDFKVYSSP